MELRTTRWSLTTRRSQGRRPRRQGTSRQRRSHECTKNRRWCRNRTSSRPAEQPVPHQALFPAMSHAMRNPTVARNPSARIDQARNM